MGTVNRGQSRRKHSAPRYQAWKHRNSTRKLRRVAPGRVAISEELPTVYEYYKWIQDTPESVITDTEYKAAVNQLRQIYRNIRLRYPEYLDPKKKIPNSLLVNTTMRLGVREPYQAQMYTVFGKKAYIESLISTKLNTITNSQKSEIKEYLTEYSDFINQVTEKDEELQKTNDSEQMKVIIGEIQYLLLMANEQLDHALTIIKKITQNKSRSAIAKTVKNNNSNNELANL